MCREESRGVNPSEFLLDQAKGEKFEYSFRSIHVNDPRALKSGAIIMMFEALCLYKGEYGRGYLSVPLNFLLLLSPRGVEIGLSDCTFYVLEHDKAGNSPLVPGSYSPG